VSGAIFDETEARCARIVTATESLIVGVQRFVGIRVWRRAEQCEKDGHRPIRIMRSTMLARNADGTLWLNCRRVKLLWTLAIAR
jgi:hypothetical protein